MAKLVTYRCPDCEGEFDFLHHPSDEPPPNQCELCGSWMGDAPQKAPVLHINIGTAKGKTPDRLYRQMEKASEERAADAAEMTGASVSEMSAIKITDMKDNMREGDNATRVNVAAAEKNLSRHAGGMTVAPVMQNPNLMTPTQPGEQNPQVAAWAAETRSGPEALTTRKLLTSMPHRNIIGQATRNGQLNKST